MTRNETSLWLRRLSNLAYGVGLALAFLVICLPGAWIVLNGHRRDHGETAGLDSAATFV